MTVRSALRIAVAPGPADRRRLLGMAAGVAVGVMLAALLWAGFTGLGDRSERSTWVQPQTMSSGQMWEPGRTLADDEIAARGLSTVFAGHAIDVLYVYGAESPAMDIPGTREGVPAGTSWVSPALASLIEQYPRDELGDRFGTVRGELPDRVLAGPDALVAVVGVDESQVNEQFIVVSELTGYRYTSETYEILAVLGAVAVLIPVAMLLGVVTSFGSVDRSARMRAFHLLGATAADRARFAAVEAGGVGLVGTIVGLLLAWVAAIPVSFVTINGSRLFPSDLRLEPGELLVAVVVVPLIFAAVAAIRAARADAQPSSVRDRQEKPLGLWRVFVLAAGVLLLWASFSGIVPMFYGLVAGFVLTAMGIVAVGPMITHGIARIAHKRARSAEGLMAYARIQRHPRQIFRAVSGVVIAVFLVSLFMAGVTSVREGAVVRGEGDLASDVLIVGLDNPATTGTISAAQEAALVDAVAAVEQVPGVTGLARIYLGSEYQGLSTKADLASVGVESTADVSVVKAFPSDGPVVMGASDESVAGLLPSSLFVATADATARERVRTVLSEHANVVNSGVTLTEFEAISDTQAREYRTLAILGVLVAAGVSAVALAAATVSAVRDRRRTLGLMRLTGMPFRTLKGIMFREAVVPLAAAVALAAIIGYGVGAMIIFGLSSGGRSVTPPPLEYYVVIVATLAMSLLAVVAAFPAARRATSGEVTRFE